MSVLLWELTLPVGLYLFGLEPGAIGRSMATLACLRLPGLAGEDPGHCSQLDVLLGWLLVILVDGGLVRPKSVVLFSSVE